MLIDKPGKIAEGLYLIGKQMCLMYLVKGKQSMIIGGGMNWIAPFLESQLDELGIKVDGIDFLVIPHPHFDHCGAVPWLKRKYPQMKVLAAGAAKTVFGKQKVIDYMEAVNLAMVDQLGLRDQYEKMNLKIDSIVVDEVVNDSTVIGLGNGLEVYFIETPGHSPGDISVYLPRLKAIFPSDAVPCLLGSVDKQAIPSPQYDFALYKKSQRKLAAYEVDICGFDHNVAVIGPDAQQVLLKTVQWCEDYGKRIVDIYKENTDFEQTYRWVARERLKFDGFAFLNEELMIPVARAEVRNILREAGINIG